jgi:hypothetical protein
MIFGQCRLVLLDHFHLLAGLETMNGPILIRDSLMYIIASLQVTLDDNLIFLKGK